MKAGKTASAYLMQEPESLVHLRANQIKAKANNELGHAD